MRAPTFHVPRFAAVLVAAVCVAAGIGAAPASAGPPAVTSATDAAFDTASGGLDVDRGAYLSKHDIVYNRPNTDPKYGLTVGNGRTGAMVWQDDGLMMQVGGVDNAQQSAFGAGNVNLRTTPALEDDISGYQQRLSLYDGTLTTHYADDHTVTVMGAPDSEVMGIHVEDTRDDVSAVTLDLSLWDVSGLGNSGDVPDLDTWKDVRTFADSDVAGLSRGQDDPQDFGYTLAATVEGAPFTTKVVDGGRVRLTITPSDSYTVWFTSSSRKEAPGHDSVAQARNVLGQTADTGYGSTLNAFEDWWHAFWQKSFVQYSDDSGQADYLENVYYLSTYMIAAGGSGDYPFHFINGVFRSTEDDTKWSNAYWYWNQRDVYNSFLASNHTDLLAGFNRLYSRNFDALKSYTKTRYGVDGIWVPETMGWDGNARGTVDSDFTQDIWSTGAEAAYNMYLQYRYTNDTGYLRDTAYPFLREVVKFYQGMLSYDEGKNEYYVKSSNAHETYWDVPNAITDLAAVRNVFPIAIEVSEQLGQDDDLRPQWQNILDHLIAYPSDDSTYLPHTPPISETRNGENVAAELIWPYDRTGIGHPDQQKAVNTWKARPFPYGNVWANDAVQAARLGLGDEAFDGMKTMLQKYQNYPNGMTNNTNGVFEYLGVHLAALNESLMQSYDGTIRVFPAIPDRAGFTGKFTLLANGGFQVSSEREAGETKYVGIKSLYGNTTKVANPWGDQQIRVRRASDNAEVLTTSDAEFTLDTDAGAVYVVERVAKPFTDYTHTTLSGSANQGAKSLAGTSSTLGLDGTANPMVNDTELTYDADWAATSARGYGDYNDDTHHSTKDGARASYTFTGTGVQYLTERNGDMGKVDVYLDGGLQATVDLKNTGARQAQQVVWQKDGLGRGSHTLEVVNRSTSVGMIDALRITP